MIEDPRLVAEICDALADEFEVDPDTCRDETLEFLQTASEHRIVQVRAGS